MNNPMVVTVDGNTITFNTPQASVSVTVHCPLVDPPSEPFECASQPAWLGDGSATVFGFVAGESAEGVGFFPAQNLGEASNETPVATWAILNDGESITAAFTRSPHLSSARSLTVTIASSEPGEEPVTFEAEPEGSGLHGSATPGWQFVPGRAYCVSVVPAWGE